MPLTLLLSVAVHLVLFYAASKLDQDAARARAARSVELTVVSPPPPPPPAEARPKEEPPPKEEPRTVEPRARRRRAEPAQKEQSAPPPEEPAKRPPPTGFSVDLGATVVGGGVAVPAIEGGGNMFADPNDRTLAPGAKTTEPPPPPAEAPSVRKDAERSFSPPEFLTDEEERAPPYPEEARRNEIEGQVLLRVLVGADGRIERVVITSRLGAGCDEIAAEYAKRTWRFRPALEDGRPVPMWITVPVTFVMDR